MISSRSVGEWWRKLRSIETDLNKLRYDMEQAVDSMADKYVEADEETKQLVDNVVRNEDFLAGVLETISGLVRDNLILEDNLREYERQHGGDGLPPLFGMPWERRA